MARVLTEQELRGARIVRKNARELVVVRRTRYQGQELLDVRVHVPNEAGGLVPLAKGVTVSPEVGRRVALAMLRVLGLESAAAIAQALAEGPEQKGAGDGEAA